MRGNIGDIFTRDSRYFEITGVDGNNVTVWRVIKNPETGDFIRTTSNDYGKTLYPWHSNWKIVKHVYLPPIEAFL